MRRRRQGLAIAIVIWGCGGSTDPSGVGTPPAHIEAVTPTALTGIVGQEVSPVPTVRVTNEDGRPVMGVVVSFELEEGGGGIRDHRIATDSSGSATVSLWVLGAAAGTFRLTARAGKDLRAVFTARAEPGPVARITPINGDGRFAATRETLLQPLQVHVSDKFDNPIPGATVTFTVITGDGFVTGNTAVTDAEGIAASGPWTLGSVPGVQRVSARSAGAEIIFSAYACDACTGMLFVSGSAIKTLTAGGHGVSLGIGFQPAPSPDGARIAFVKYDQNFRSDIYLMDADGSNVVRRTSAGGVLGSGPPGYHSPAWSPDGRYLAVASGDLYDGNVQLLSVTDVGQAPVVLSPMAAAPAWSPDGSRIAFVSLSGDDGYQALHVMDADGSNEREVIPRDEGSIDRPAWSPTGEWIAFSKCLAGCDIFVVRPDGRDLTRLTDVNIGVSPSWSPDGSSIAFTVREFSNGANRSHIALVNASGGAPVTIIPGHSPAWWP